jgi:hypothetical protein
MRALAHSFRRLTDGKKKAAPCGAASQQGGLSTPHCGTDAFTLAQNG